MAHHLNLEDIARLAGVSRSTVSRVINDHPNVSERTRRKVWRVVREQNFRPNLVARALVTHQTRILSLVIPQAIAYTFTDPYFPLLIQGVMSEANGQDYAVMLWVGSSTEEEERFCDRILNNSTFDGVLVASAVTDDPLIPRLTHAGFPLVVVGPPPLENLNYVDVNNVEGARTAVRHLIEVGRQRVAVITGPLNMGAARDRLEGYIQALEDAGRSPDGDLVVEGDFNEAAGYACMKTLLQRKVDGVFASSDMLAMGALRAIQERGLRVPDDISLVGFDDLPVAATSNPPLTTVRQPIFEMGAQAAQALIGLLDGTLAVPYQQILSTELVVRGSCGAVSREALHGKDERR